MAATIDATVGGENSNSYATLAEAQAYFDERLNVDSWTAASTDTQNRSLIQATRIIDASYEWQGERASSTQALDWPRDSVYDCNFASGHDPAGRK